MMRILISLPVLLFMNVSCKTTGVSHPQLDDVQIVQGMQISEVVEKIGKPESVEKGKKIGKLTMDKWHYEIVLSEVSEYQEIDTYIQPSNENFRVIKPQQMVDEEGIETIRVDITRMLIMDILVYQDRVFAVQSKIEESAEEEDWRER